MEFNFIDISQIEDERIILESVKENIQTISLLKKEVERLRRVKSNSLQIDSEEQIEAKEETISSNNVYEDLEFEEEVLYYMQDLEKKYEHLEEMKEILPSKHHLYYQRLINRLKGELWRKVIEIKQFLEEDKTVTKKELEDFKNEIQTLNENRNNLAILQNEQEETTEEEDKNQLIFLPTTTGNIYIIDDLSNLSKEYYDGFIELFQSIENRTFKKVKRFSNNNMFGNISEVRGNKIRIIFDRIGPTEYVLIAALVKKSDQDKNYREFLATRIANYNSQKQILIENVKDKEFINKNQQLTEELYNLLSERNTKKVRKIGDLNAKK